MSDWPVDRSGVVETVVTTRGPNDRWNVAALGVHAGDPPTAKTYGNTRTRRNFHREGGGVVQFVRDPVLFVRAALDVYEVDDPVLPDAYAWVDVDVEPVGVEEAAGGTRVERWRLRAVESTVERKTVPTISRGHAAVVEATVAASRLGVTGYDDGTLRERLAYFESVVDRCGGPREREAFGVLSDLVG